MCVCAGDVRARYVSRGDDLSVIVNRTANVIVSVCRTSMDHMQSERFHFTVKSVSTETVTHNGRRYGTHRDRLNGINHIRNGTDWRSRLHRPEDEKLHCVTYINHLESVLINSINFDMVKIRSI